MNCDLDVKWLGLQFEIKYGQKNAKSAHIFITNTSWDRRELRTDIWRTREVAQLTK
jgi:hypothetical protein